MLIEIDNFLTKEECEYFIGLIDKSNHRSTVSASGDQAAVVSDVRTSSTSTLPMNEEKVANLKKKISAFLGIPIEKGEPLQGQLYEPGQFFKPHNDYFSGEDYNNHCLHSGNRTNTFMIFLNEGMEGGETNFPVLQRKFKPIQGKGLSWDLIVDGEFQRDMLHEGSEVKAGRKYIITSWWRENEWNGSKDDQLAKEYQLKKKMEPTTNLTKPTFSKPEDLPRLTTHGFEVIKVPEDAWNLIKEAYTLLKDRPQEEHFPGKEGIIPTGTTEMLSFENLPTIRKTLHNMLRPLHEKWCRSPLVNTFIYGIRSYGKDSTLVPHVDRIATHHISSIIIVDKDLACGCSKTKGVENDWALDIQAHDGTWHKVYTEIGDMILYESAVCEHGRKDPFKGNYFRNFYVHYKLDGWEYVG